MIVAIHQPEYLPWLGFFDKAMHADLFVLLDSVQFRKNNWQNRNRIRSANGPMWLSVPVSLKDGHKQLIRSVPINNREAKSWRVKTWKSIELAYRRAPFFDVYAAFFESVYSRQWDLVIDLNYTLLDYLFNALDIPVRRVSSSDLNLHSSRTDLLVDICRQVGASTYFSGISGKEYLEISKFTDAGIEVLFQEFHHPIYKQMYEPFIPCMSVIDLMFNCGPASRDIINGIGVQRVDHLFE